MFRFRRVPLARSFAVRAFRHPAHFVHRRSVEHLKDMIALLVPLELLRALLLFGGEVRGEEEHRHLAVVVERRSELVELVVELIEQVVLHADLEERARIYLGDLLHGVSAPLRRR